MARAAMRKRSEYRFLSLNPSGGVRPVLVRLTLTTLRRLASAIDGSNNFINSVDFAARAAGSSGGAQRGLNKHRRAIEETPKNVIEPYSTLEIHSVVNNFPELFIRALCVCVLRLLSPHFRTFSTSTHSSDFVGCKSHSREIRFALAIVSNISGSFDRKIKVNSEKLIKKETLAPGAADWAAGKLGERRANEDGKIRGTQTHVRRSCQSFAGGGNAAEWNALALAPITSTAAAAGARII